MVFNDVLSPTMAPYEDRSTQWSEYTRDSHGFYVSSRRKADGKIEQRYSVPETSAPRQLPDGQSTYSQSSNALIQDSSNSPNVATSPNQFTYAPDPQYTNYAFLDDGPGEGHDTFDLGTPLYPRSFQTPAAPFKDPSASSIYPSPLAHEDADELISDYPSGSMTSGLANLSLNSGRATSSLTYGEDEEAEDQQIPETFGKRIRRAPNSRDYEELDERYRAIDTKNLKKFWKVGRVFMMLWTEPARKGPPTGGTRNGSHYSLTWLNGQVFSEIRRFVVISVNHGSTVCSPIHTYNSQATLKPNLPEVQEHAIIHTSENAPIEMYYLDEDGSAIYEGLTKDPIRVTREQKDKEGDLGDCSRINFSKIYTVENFVRVLKIGMVHSSSMDSLIRYARVKPRENSPEPPRQHKKHSSSGHKDDKKGSERDRSRRAKGSDKKRF